MTGVENFSSRRAKCSSVGLAARPRARAARPDLAGDDMSDVIGFFLGLFSEGFSLTIFGLNIFFFFSFRQDSSSLGM